MRFENNTTSVGVITYTTTDGGVTILGGGGGSGGISISDVHWSAPQYQPTVADQAFDYLEVRGVVRSDTSDGEIIRTVISFVWAAFLTLLMIAETASGKMASNLAVFAGITPLMLAQNLGIIAFTVVGAVILWTVKPLRFSWLSLFNGGQEGGDNIHVAPMRLPWIGVLFGVLFFVNLPAFALIEERMFRLGVVEWSEAFRWAFIFGMVHCLAGVPIAAGIALTIPGLWFHYQCFEGGVILSTQHHTAYNAILVSLMLGGAIVTSVAGKKP